MDGEHRDREGVDCVGTVVTSHALWGYNARRHNLVPRKCILHEIVSPNVGRPPTTTPAHDFPAQECAQHILVGQLRAKYPQTLTSVAQYLCCYGTILVSELVFRTKVCQMCSIQP